MTRPPSTPCASVPYRRAKRTMVPITAADADRPALRRQTNTSRAKPRALAILSRPREQIASARYPALALSASSARARRMARPIISCACRRSVRSRPASSRWAICRPTRRCGWFRRTCGAPLGLDAADKIRLVHSSKRLDGRFHRCAYRCIWVRTLRPAPAPNQRRIPPTNGRDRESPGHQPEESDHVHQDPLRRRSPRRERCRPCSRMRWLWHHASTASA